MRKEIEAEMKTKYENKENDKNVQNVKNEVINLSLLKQKPKQSLLE